MRTASSVVIIFVLMSGCVTEGLQNESLALVREEDRKTCGDFASRESEPALLQSREELGEMALYLLVPGLNIFTAFGLPFMAHHHAQKRREIYDGALAECLKRFAMEATLKPDGREVSETVEQVAD